VRHHPVLRKRHQLPLCNSLSRISRPQSVWAWLDHHYLRTADIDGRAKEDPRLCRSECPLRAHPILMTCNALVVDASVEVTPVLDEVGVPLHEAHPGGELWWEHVEPGFTSLFSPCSPGGRSRGISWFSVKTVCTVLRARPKR